MHVLILDEDAAVRSAISEIAASRGFLPHAVATVEAAREYLRGNSTDLLLLDLKSPNGEGIELLDEVKTLQSDTSVVVMTAFATVTSAVEVMRTGATDYLTKPFAMEELAAVLERTATDRSKISARSSGRVPRWISSIASCPKLRTRRIR